MNHSSHTRTRNRITGFLVLALIGLALVTLIPKAQAAASLVQNTYGQAGSCGTSLAKAFGSDVGSGTILIVAFQWNGLAITASSVSDTKGNTWTKAVDTGLAGANNYAAIFYASSASAGADTITASWTTTSNSVCNIDIYEVSGITTTIGTGTGSGVGTSFSTSSTAFASGAFLVSVIYSNLGTENCVAGSGFTLSVPNNNMCSQYAVGGVSSPTTFPMTGSSMTWGEAGASFDPNPTVDYTRSPSATVSLAPSVKKSETLKASSTISLSASIIKKVTHVVSGTISLTASIIKSTTDLVSSVTILLTPNVLPIKGTTSTSTINNTNTIPNYYPLFATGLVILGIMFMLVVVKRKH